MTAVSLYLPLKSYQLALEEENYFPKPIIAMALDYLDINDKMIATVVIPKGENPYAYAKKNQLLEFRENEVNIIWATFMVTKYTAIPDCPPSRITEIVNILQFKSFLVLTQHSCADYIEYFNIKQCISRAKEIDNLMNPKFNPGFSFLGYDFHSYLDFEIQEG